MSDTITKSIAIHRAPADVFTFLLDGANWPRWAVHNIRGIRSGPGGTWELDTPRGPGRLALRPEPRFGILDHTFIDTQDGRWDVPARVVVAGGGSVFMLTLTKPEGMAEADFQAGSALLDDELRTLKRLLESETQGAIAEG